MRFRKVLFATMFVFAASGLAALAQAANFSDVPANHANYQAIQSLKDANVISGYPDGTFKPDQTLTRAEAVAIILKAAGIETQRTSARMPFNDVLETAWFFPMIQKGVALGKLKGYSDGTFKPMNSITLPESITMALSFLGISIANVDVEPVIYSGLNVTDWYAGRMQYAKNTNIIEPDSDGIVSPTAPVTRARFAEIIYRMRMVKQTGVAYDITGNWMPVENPDNFWKLKAPPGWEIFKGQKNAVIWKRDPDAGNAHAFFTRIWPKSARVSISYVENPENSAAPVYFANLKSLYERTYTRVKTHSSQITISERSAMKIWVPENRIVDLIIALPNRNFLIMNGEYGNAPIGEFLEKQIETIEMSYVYAENPAPLPPIPLTDRLETLNENILVAGKWSQIAPLFPDKRLIHTDAIGVGTGPVDYYFTREANLTIKLERNSRTVLNTRDGETTAF